MQEKATQYIKKTFFSVVIPVYNKGPHIHRSISSVLNQTYQNFELILVNDASTDNSLEEIQKFTDERIRLFHRSEPGPGGYAARNLGIEKAKGEWVAFLDADDEWFDEHLERLYQLSETQNEGFLAEGWCNSFSDGRVEQIPYLKKCKSQRAAIRLTFDQYLSARAAKMNPFQTSAIAISRRLLQESGGFPAGKCHRGGDTGLWLRLIYQCRYVRYSLTTGSIYHRQNSGVIAQNPPLGKEEYAYKIAQQLLQDSNNFFSGRRLKKYMNSFVYNCLYLKVKRGELKIQDCNDLYFFSNTKKNMFFIACSLLPANVQMNLLCGLSTLFKMLRRKIKRSN